MIVSDGSFEFASAKIVLSTGDHGLVPQPTSTTSFSARSASCPFLLSAHLDLDNGTVLDGSIVLLATGHENSLIVVRDTDLSVLAVEDLGDFLECGSLGLDV